MANHVDEQGKSAPAQSKIAKKMRIIGRSAPPKRTERSFMQAQMKARKEGTLSKAKFRKRMRIESASRKPVGTSVI